jgi:hypothetical protein
VFGDLRSVGFAFLAFVVACGGQTATYTEMPAAADGGGIGRPRLAAPLRPKASCEVVIDTPPLVPGSHVVDGTPLTFTSNPPTSGAHYPSWANFEEFGAPIEDGYLVHSLEHGAIALLYKCEGAACTSVVEGLRKVRDALTSDVACDPSIRVRVVIAPYPKLDVPVAAAAWGWTYKAQCVDSPTLTAFAKEHYAQGPENLCAPGRTF